MPAIQYKFYSIQTVQRLHKLYYYYDYVVDVANYLLQQGCIEIYSAVRLVGRPFSRTKSPSRTKQISPEPRYATYNMTIGRSSYY